MVGYTKATTKQIIQEENSVCSDLLGLKKDKYMQKKRQRSSVLFGGQKLFFPCRASCFAQGRFEE